MHIQYDFSELGIPLPGGWLFGFFDGSATIDIDDDGDWSISGIVVEKRKYVDGKWLLRSHVLDVRNIEERQWYHAICTALEMTRANHIQEAVEAELREHAPFTYQSTISAGRTP